jgi:pantetheine-phosphate adenylyltransferase
VVPREGCFGVKEEINLLKAKVPKEESSIVLYGGSFDPFHRGHLEVVKRAVEKGMFVVIAVLQNPDKKSFLTLTQRENITLLTLAKAGLSGSTRVTGRYTSIVGALASEGCSQFLRGIRKDDPSSVNEEKTRAALLKSETGIETVLIPTSGLLSSYSSSSIKELIKTGHPAYGIPSFVRSILYRRHTSKEITLVVGGIATGKTTFCKDYSRFHTIDLDAVAKKYLYANPAFKESPEKILRYFRSPQKYFGYMNRVRPIIMAGVIQEINTLPGSTPIIIQCNKLGLFWKELLRLCNYNIIYLEDIPQEVAEARVAGRGSSKETLLAVLNLEKLAPTYEEISSFVEKRVRQAASLGLMVPEDTFETQLISRRP